MSSQRRRSALRLQSPETKLISSFWIPRVIIVFLLIILGLWISWFVVALDAWGPPATEADRLARLGQVGDSFGSLNTLLSGFAILGVSITLYKQHRDGLDADERHDEALAEQSRIASITGLNTIIAQSLDAIREAKLKQGKINLIVAYRTLMPVARDLHFLPYVAKHYADGRPYVYLLFEFIGPIGPKESAGVVETKIDELLTKSLPALEEGTAWHIDRLNEALAKLEDLSGAGLKFAMSEPSKISPASHNTAI